MATFEYVEIPPDAVRLRPSSLEPAAKILTTLPDPSPPRPLSELVSPARAALALVPQMLLSSTIPPSTTTSAVASAIATATPRMQSSSLLSTRDPLSVPIMTANFRRFVSKVGPIFWLQDRVEEIIFWKKGWKRTAVWLTAYGFLCYFPRMALLIPHVALLGVMLYCYPDPGAPPVQINVGEGAADWQANIQAIQNLMGAVSDAHDAIVPLLPLLLPSQVYPPLQPKSHSRFPSTAPYEPASNPASGPSRRTTDVPDPTQPATRPHHPLLIATLLSFFVFLLALVADLLPLRLLFFLAGAGTVCAFHPCTRDLLSGVVLTALSGSGPGLSFRLTITVPRLPHLPSPLSFLPIGPHRVSHPSPSQIPAPRTHTFALTIAPRDVYLFFRRLIDDDRLDDTAWHAPLSQVELWENERWVQDTTETKRRKSVVMLVREGRETEEDSRDDDVSSTTSTMSTGTVTGLADVGKGTGTGGTWSKTNLKPSERVGWTRGRDGWSGVGGEVSSNLTFSLSPGWAFVETEGWRPDLSASWAFDGAAPCSSVCVGADEDGWTYTTDTWTHPRPDGRPNDGWVTRRRRWVRRVCFKGGEP